MEVYAPRYNKSLVGANRSLQSSQNEAVDDMQVFFHYRFLQITLLETVLLYYFHSTHVN
jgi:hypothetical protein